MFDPTIASKLAKCGITMLDAPEDVFEAAEIYLGSDPTTKMRLKLAGRGIVGGKNTTVRPLLRLHPALNALASGDICISLSWNGLILQARARGAAAAQPVEVAYASSQEKAQRLWFDTVAIPADAPHPGTRMPSSTS